MVLIILSLPAVVSAESQLLECNIKFGNFDDLYTIEIDEEKNMVNSTYHAASSHDKSVTIDYKISSDAVLYDEKVIFKASLHSLNYIYEINRKTLGIVRYLNDVNDANVGSGSCIIIEASGKKL